MLRRALIEFLTGLPLHPSWSPCGSTRRAGTGPGAIAPVEVFRAAVLPPCR
jgi:hypothetical protein